LTPEIIATLRDMLQVNPAWRYQSALDLVPSLDDVIAIKQDEDRGSLALNFLLRRLERRPEFPACSYSIGEINRLTEENSNTDFNKLGAVIVRDYSLTNRILKIANSVIFDRGGEGVKIISMAVSRLGLKLVRMICNGMLLFKEADNKNSDLKDILVASFVAGLIARHITASIKRSISEEAFICALFHNLGLHLLVFYLPDEYEDIRVLIDKGEGRQKAERAILSTTCASLGIAVAEKWNFPETIGKYMTHLPPGKLEKPNRDEDILCHAANFANELCELFITNKKSTDLLIEIDVFIARHEVIFDGGATRLAQLASATAEKFSDLAPGPGVNYNDSRFCKGLSNFSSAIEKALVEEAMLVELVAVS
jgi:HD-like signal output (HDOD) protein